MSISSALAVDFAFVTAAGAAHDVVIDIGGVTYNVDVATGTYRMFLAQSTEDFIAVLNAAIVVALAGSGQTCVLTLLSSGKVRMTASVAMTFTPCTEVRQLLGNLTGGPSTSLTSSWHPRHMALFDNLAGGCWRPITSVATGKAASGVVYGWSAGVTRWERELQARFVPRTAADATYLNSDATPWRPPDDYMNALNPSTATARQWTLCDVLIQAVNAECGLALGTWASLIAEQPAGPYVATFHQGYVDESALTEPTVALSVAAWEAFHLFNLPFVLPNSAASDTRT